MLKHQFLTNGYTLEYIDKALVSAVNKMNDQLHNKHKEVFYDNDNYTRKINHNQQKEKDQIIFRIDYLSDNLNSRINKLFHKEHNSEFNLINNKANKLCHLGTKPETINPCNKGNCEVCENITNKDNTKNCTTRT